MSYLVINNSTGDKKEMNFEELEQFLYDALYGDELSIEVILEWARRPDCGETTSLCPYANYLIMRL
jgi:hypothetical protein